MSEETAVVHIGSQQVQKGWGGAAERGLQARQARLEIIQSVLKPGVDFGVVPGTQKPTLLKPGAEKINDCLNLYPDYERIQTTEDWDKPLFHYAYRCLLRDRNTGSIVATGIGSCNSMESKYRWRKAQRVCPQCGTEAIIKGKAEYGGGWLCFAKKQGCGAKFKPGDQNIEGQQVGRVPNDDVFSQVNTIDKMTQKRALVAATLNLGFSEQFTQDMEDLAHAVDEDQPEPLPADSHDQRPQPQEHKPSDALAPRRAKIMNALIGKGKPFEGKLVDAKNWVFLGVQADVMALNADQCDAVEAAIKNKEYVGFKEKLATK